MWIGYNTCKLQVETMKCKWVVRKIGELCTLYIHCYTLPTKGIKHSFVGSLTETWKLWINLKGLYCNEKHFKQDFFYHPFKFLIKPCSFQIFKIFQNTEVPVNMPAMPIIDDPLLLQLHLQHQQERMIAQR